MKVEVLASVMNASLPETVQHMNLQSDAVIINQCDRLGQEEMQISPGNGRIRFCSFPDRGIGRSRNEAILRAEGEKKSTILVAEGKKASAILDAEAEKEAAILRAEAQKERMIREAEGQAEAILKVQQANADGLRFLKEAAPDQSVLQLKALDAFMKASDGKATKIIIPSEIQGMAGLVTSMAELAKKDQKEEPKA